MEYNYSEEEVKIVMNKYLNLKLTHSDVEKLQFYFLNFSPKGNFRGEAIRNEWLDTLNKFIEDKKG